MDSYINEKYEELFRKTLPDHSVSKFEDPSFLFTHNGLPVTVRFDTLKLPKAETTLLKCFCLYVVSKRSPNTCNKKLRELAYLFDYLKHRGISLDKLNDAILDDFAVWLHETVPSDNKKHGIVEAVNGLLNFIFATYGSDNDWHMTNHWHIERNSGKRAPEKETMEALDMLFFNFSIDIPTDIRCCYMIERLVLRRISEVLRIKLDCLSFCDDDMFIIRIDSTKKQPMGIPAETSFGFLKAGYIEQCLLKAVEMQIAYAQSVQGKTRGKGKLFVSTEHPNRILRQDEFNRYLKMVCEREHIIDSNGEPVHITSHLFRHFGVTRRAEDHRFTSQMIADEASHKNEQAIMAYRRLAASEEKERMRETQRPMLEKGALPDAPAHRIVSERNYNRLLQTPGMKLIPDAGVCNGATCTARFERCISCHYFAPDPSYIPAFTACCKVIEERNSGLQPMNAADAAQLALFKAFIERANGEHATT